MSTSIKKSKNGTAPARSTGRSVSGPTAAAPASREESRDPVAENQPTHPTPRKGRRPSKVVRPRVKTEPTPFDLVRRAEKAIDDFWDWRNYSRAIHIAENYRNGTILRSDLSAPYRARFDPDFDDTDQLIEDEYMYGDLLVKAVRAASSCGGPFARFADERDGRLYLTLPDGIFLDLGKCNCEMKSRSLDWFGGVTFGIIVFEAGQKPEIPFEWIEWGECDASMTNLKFTFDEDGNAKLEDGNAKLEDGNAKLEDGDAKLS